MYVPIRMRKPPLTWVLQDTEISVWRHAVILSRAVPTFESHGELKIEVEGPIPDLAENPVSGWCSYDYPHGNHQH